MQTPFTEAAEAVRDIAMWEAHRIKLTEFLIGTGKMSSDEVSLIGWRKRLVRLRAAAAILAVLARHEAAARLLDLDLAIAQAILADEEPDLALTLASRRGVYLPPGSHGDVGSGVPSDLPTAPGARPPGEAGAA